MCDVSVLPSEYSKITLLKYFSDNNIKDVRCEISPGSQKGDNYVGEIRRIKVISKRDESVLHNFIIKYTPNRERFKTFDIDGIYDREATMYNEILPFFKKLQTEFHIPDEETFKTTACFKADNQILLFEDLAVQGYQMHNRFDCYDSDHLELVLNNLGRFHALSFAVKEYYPDVHKNFLTLVEKEILDGCMEAMFENLSDQILQVVDDSIKEKIDAFCKNAANKYREITNANFAAPFNVFCHGDCWNNNILFKYKNGAPVDVKFLDWQVSRYSSPMIDIAYMLYCSTDSKIRSDYGEKIFDIYYGAFSKHLHYFKLDAEKCFPRKVFDKQIREISVYGLLMGIVVLPIILTEKGNEVDIDDMIETDKNSGKKLHFGKLNTERLNDLIMDFVRMDML